MPRRRISVLALGFVTAILAALPMLAMAADHSFISRFHNISTIASTVPANGDINPYGIAVIPHSVGRLTRGHVLISNFNAASNFQGTGTTIVDIAPNGEHHVFAQISNSDLNGPCPGGVGLTTALVVLQRGWVIVGSLPTSDGTSATAQAGCLIVLNSAGKVAETFAGHGVNGPWDAAVRDRGNEATLFVTNVLNGTVAANGNVEHHGTVLRIKLGVPDAENGPVGEKPWIMSRTIVGSGFAERTDPAALVIGPTGLGIGNDESVFVADSLNNRITVLPNAFDRMNSAGTGDTLFKGGALNDPLGLTVGPDQHILVVNGNDGKLIEINRSGEQVAVTQLDNTVIPGSDNGAGTLFGLVVAPYNQGVYFVDDGTNTLNLLH